MARSPKTPDSISTLSVTATDYVADDLAAVIALSEEPLDVEGLAKAARRSVECVRRVLKANPARFVVTSEGVEIKART